MLHCGWISLDLICTFDRKSGCLLYSRTENGSEQTSQKEFYIYYSTVNLKLDFLGLGNPIHTEISILTNNLLAHFIPIHLIQPY